MPVHDIFETQPEEENREFSPRKKGQFLPALVTRFLFLFLLVGDLLWMAYALTFFATSGILALLTFFRLPSLVRKAKKQFQALKRSSICAFALLIALFNPPFGIVIACTYFLMYDKGGIQRLIPASLREQFREFFEMRGI